ncbi:putative iron-regulated membrane protein [Pedobacter cryoconitis]|uniref:Putative iron-regulated membrane protein n=1 Tax=Pedobacter cryoconitis TaxID=188932 RepID=A0A7W8YUH7_9SPHI|nr:PepSY-associated TM helix domain-containing protein [Pedobacter cryoconitis]MBB5621887.1 putative iron-regulated membrane protein [Pedobacter cryoconitis]
MKKTLISIHLWIGILSGLVVVILGLTGCVLVFVEEIKPFVYADRLEVRSVSQNRLSMQDMVQKAKVILGKDKPVSALEIGNDPRQNWQFRSYREDTNPGHWYWNEKKFYESLFMDPYTGQLVLHEQSEFEFFRVILYLHWSLLLKTELGQPIVGVVTLLYVLSLLTGLYLWWPKNKKARRVRFWFKWKKNTGLKRKNYDLHNIFGFYAFSVGLIIAFTGMVWAFPLLDRGLQHLLDVGNKSTKTTIAPVYAVPETPEEKGLDFIYADIKKKYPDAKAYHFYFPNDTSSRLTVLARYEPTLKTVITQYNMFSGQLMKISTFEDKSSGEKFSSMNYDIHTGSILGLPGKILAFLGSLVSASLPLTGFLIWYNKKWGKKKTARN